MSYFYKQPEYQYICPLCGLPLNEHGTHINGSKAWDLYNCEYGTAYQGDTHPPVPVNQPEIVTNDTVFSAMADEAREITRQIKALEEHLSNLHINLAKRELQILNPVPSTSDTYRVDSCRCVRCRQYRMNSKEQAK